MGHSYPFILLTAGVLILGSLAASRFTGRFGVPSLLAILSVGLLFGNGEYGFDYNYPVPTLHFSEIALCIIIFAGGFESNWKKVRPILGQGLALATLGVLITMLIVGGVTHWVLHWPWLEALLLGAVVSSTDAAAVFSILESTNLKLKSGVREVLELESGTNDPMGFFLTISLCGLLIATEQPPGPLIMIGDFLWTMSVGGLSGWAVGKTMLLFADKSELKPGQYPVVLLAWILILYAINVLMGGSAFLAVFVAGMVLGNSPWLQRVINLEFFKSLSWLMETSLFLILALQVYLFELDNVAWEALLIALLLIFVARPIGTFLSLAFFPKVPWQAKTFYAWVGLRGATPIVFALIPVVQQVPDATKIFNIAFIIVIVSMLLQGTTVAKVAEWTKMKVPQKEKVVPTEEVQNI